MVYIRFPQTKIGVNPSQKTMLNPASVSPTEKITLVRDRIWGNMLSGNERSGFKELKEVRGEATSNYYDQSLLKMMYPFVSNWAERNKKKMKYQERKSRIYMRGIKIGTKRTSKVGDSMNMFEKAKSKEGTEELNDTKAALVQLREEALAKEAAGKK